MTSTPSPAAPVWSCDERDRAGNCRNAHGCHCREIATQALLLSERESEIERLKAQEEMDDRLRDGCMDKLLETEAQLTEVRAEVERLKDPERAERFLQITLQRDRVEARLQQALEGLEKAAERLSVEAQSAGTILAVQVLRRKMGDISADLFTTLAAIQGDSHER